MPFLELSEGRLQGVVASESQRTRIYASSVTAASVTAGEHGLNCRSNEHQPCGGLGEKTPCRHIEAMLAQAVKEFGVQRVARYLGIEVADGQTLGSALHPTSGPSHAVEVFESFMRHMTYLQVPVSDRPTR